MHIVDFVASLQCRLSELFHDAEVEYFGDNLTVWFKNSDASGDFVHLLIDMTCMKAEDRGCIAVHARPTHIFDPVITVETNGSRTITLENHESFVDGDWSDEHEDGLCNFMWMFEFPDDSHRITVLACGLTKIAANYFAGTINHSSSSKRNISLVGSVMPCACSCARVMSI